MLFLQVNWFIGILLEKESRFKNTEDTIALSFCQLALKFVIWVVYVVNRPYSHNRTLLMECYLFLM